jgi:hypothetical protein
MPVELTEQQLVKELNEENANRIALGHSELTLEQWKATRKPRFKPTE